ncbi:MAG: Dimethylallyltransferase (EC / (2E,6E)-farnesyl diphosphate synthase (EC / Geranylgeranyl pyrophosphate synthetase (EC [uncultured Aureispira sp.]|uniref:Dimethylallyltransferase -farnesyl diphosphate synthase )) n=1 Tax=uncultured Aureispira sp. TaxID=1331704 RepID=A0A6S6S7B8_9BACT|nr:MAG: Dimethylallyltransferase (EC / (2E,6E)-farnesyl diphosphate synthase (EC / Geranylgeranyl pyrophosphate synthetase (EC [uncultured Aureispira sp.]
MNIHELFKTYQKENNFSQYTPRELYEPIDYILSLGGKQIRPLLALMACQLFSKDVHAALPIASAVEIFHNFSLVHDDIMDASPIRRGQPAVHKKFNTNTAILSGDVMLVYAYEHLSKVSPELLPIILPIFNEVAIGVCEGQQMDVNFETQAQVSLPEYTRMIELKTSILLYGAMKMGALVGGASIEEAELIGEFGRNMGIAFQMQDDWLDTFGAQAKVGKRIGGDIIQNKKTALVIKALELADATTEQELNQLLSSTPTAAAEAAKIERVTSIFKALGIPDEMKKIMAVYKDKAIHNLNLLNVSDDAKKSLYGFLDALMQREH